MIVYIDDILLMGDSPNQVESHLEALVFILTNLGFIINVPKSVTTPTQIIEFLGLLVNSTSLHLGLPGEKLLDGGHITPTEGISYSTPVSTNYSELSAASQAVLPYPCTIAPYKETYRGD